MWRNIFDLGEVDLYYYTGNDGMRPIAELPGGTVAVVDGVIQCRDLPDPYIGQFAIIAIPRGRPAGAAHPGRITLANVDIPRASSFSDVFLASAGAWSQSESGSGQDVFVSFTQDANEPIVTADFDPNPADGEVPADTGSTEYGLYFMPEEIES